ncbi:hydroxyisourate hydrolase [Phytohabitans sp. LJ34]|uniref:hydroxyisourate hydrolase n=1 Tax=Phytohabitans sp. LJ34 TaxID=3452217 RepID=UPI003F894E72
MVISTLVVDGWSGRPAAGVSVRLDRLGHDRWRTVAAGSTGEDGTTAQLRGLGQADPGLFRITFETNAYFAELGLPAANTEITLTFTIARADERYELALLISPYMYVIYRRC